jgi:hypothetical protein
MSAAHGRGLCVPYNPLHKEECRKDETSNSAMNSDGSGDRGG